MANKVVIDVEARFVDNVTGQAGSASSAFKKVETSAKSATKAVDSMGKAKAKPQLDASTEKFKKAIDDSDKKLSKFGKTTATAKLDADDKATSKVNKALNAMKNFGKKTVLATLDAKDWATAKIKSAANWAKNFAGKTYSAAVTIKDSAALSTLKKMSSNIEKVTGKTWKAVVKVTDMATAPLKSIKNMLFSIKSLATAVFAGFAVKKGILDPVNTADQYSSAKIGFSTLIGETAGQQMMDDLDAFAKKTPFNTSGVIDSARKMMAMGWDTDNLLGDLEVFGNAAAATGNLNQGLESIVRAMSQIKTKGRLSTEELNQLAEAGIAAKAMLAENLGYGTGDEGIAAMTKDLEKGAIASNVAIEALIAGMQKYDGMMDSMATETVDGLASQLSDAYEISVKRRWGQGLQDGLKRALGTGVNLIDDAEAALERLGDVMYELGSKASNWFADKFDAAMKKVQEITDSYDFENAGLGEKISMLWTGLVADPLKEWFSHLWTDEENIEKATEIGMKFAQGLTNGILAVLGLTDILKDTGDGAEEAGSNIAQGFAKGFAEGFDASAITDKLVEAISNVWGALPTWAKVLVGGYGVGKATGGIANFAGGLVNFIGGVGNVIGSRGTIGADGNVTGAAGLLGLISPKVIGSTGNYMVSGTGLMGGLAKAGYAFTGGPASAGAYFGAGMSGGTAAAIGAAGIAGGVIGGATLIKGGSDIIKSYYEDDATEKQALEASGNTAVAATLGGAAIGTAILPGLGTLIGAGIGGLAGWIGGDMWADDIRAAAYETERMKEAVKDSELSAEELAQEMAKAKWETARQQFGDIALSMDEIARLSKQVVFGKDLAKYEKFNTALSAAAANLEAMNAAGQQTDRWMWKAGLGVTFNEDEVEAIKASFDDYINSAKSYVENKHYEFTASAEMLLDLESETGKSILEGGNAYYAEIQGQLNAAGEELGTALTKALENGFINADESAAIAAAQQKIADITKKLADAEADSEAILLELKFGTGNLDVDSFNAFMQETQANLDSRLQSADAALTAQLTNLNLRFPTDADKQKPEYQQQLQALIEGYNLEVEGITAEILGLELKITSKALSGDTALGQDALSDLQTLLNQCIQNDMEPTELTHDALIKLNPNMSTENEGLIKDYLQSIYDQLNLDDYESITINADGTVSLNLKPEEGAEGKVKEAVDSSVPDSVDATVAVNIHGNKTVDPVTVLAEEFQVPPMVATETVLALTAAPTFQNQIDILCQDFGIEPSQAETILWALSGDPQYMNTITPTAGDFGIPSSIDHTITVNITANPVYSGFGGFSLGGESDGEGFRGGIFGGSSAMGSYARGGIIGDRIPGFSNGGMVRGGSQLIEVAEEGSPEMVIPLSSQRRDRGLKLWAQAGRMMGVPGFARGGAVGGDGGADEGIRFQEYGSDSDAGSGQTVQIEVGGITVEINVNATNNENIVDAIKAQANEIAEVVSGVLVEAFSGQYENTPLRGGVG